MKGFKKLVNEYRSSLRDYKHTAEETLQFLDLESDMERLIEYIENHEDIKIRYGSECFEEINQAMHGTINVSYERMDYLIEQVEETLTKAIELEENVKRYFEIQNKSILGFASAEEKKEMRDLKEKIEKLLEKE